MLTDSITFSPIQTRIVHREMEKTIHTNRSVCSFAKLYEYIRICVDEKKIYEKIMRKRTSSHNRSLAKQKKKKVHTKKNTTNKQQQHRTHALSHLFGKFNL